ncbi:DUF4105 domain-containing protein [Bdellovibrio sp. HCB2-146]|uniref:DUF7844 domain-containing protein n=1 Tax=Bdellovibrio sp. HCB2-146 TaxID=3394362 RepID=UPI0039BD8F0E
MKTTTALAITCVLLFGFSSHASIRLQNNSSLNAADTALIESKIQKSVSLLPSAIKAVLADKKITFSFAALGKQSVDLKQICSPNFSHRLAQTKPSRQNPVIILDNSLKQIALGKENFSFPCGHEQSDRLFQAVVIHELGHVYDFSSRLSDKEFQELSKCHFEKVESASKMQSQKLRSTPRCEYLASRKRLVSDRNSFEILSQAKRNKLGARVPEAYELTSLEESFAVNLEYFLLDPDYQCRRPSFYQYYAKQFKHEPFKGRNCDTVNYALSGDDGRPVSLDASRVYQVHYFMGGPGKALMSRWGHSMVRLIVCSPDRATVGTDCLQDISHHVIVSFRANVADIVTNYWKGLSGAYPSQLFILPMSQVTTEYNRNEERDLLSYPLSLTEEQKNLFVKRVMELHWSYRGKYYFVSNNCAGETFELITGVLPEGHPLLHKVKPVTPQGVADLLQSAGLMPKFAGTNQDLIDQGYLFPSKVDEDLHRSFAAIRPLVQARYKTLEQYLESSTAEERASLVESLTTHNKNAAALAASFFLLEVKIDRDLTKVVQEEVMKMIDSEAGEKYVEEYKDMIRQLTPTEHLSKGYGIPMRSEFDVNAFKGIHHSFNTNFKDLAKLIAEKNPELSQEKVQTQDNINNFFRAQFKFLTP